MSRAEQRPGGEVCPYCHDLADDPAALVECGGCGTRHHAECVAELGRCTVLGCERPLVAPPGPSPAGGKVREEVRRRVRRFVERNATPAQPDSTYDRQAVALAREEVSEALGAAHVLAALRTLQDVELRIGGGRDRLDIPGWMSLSLLRGRIEDAERGVARGERRLPCLLMVLAGMVLMTVGTLGLLLHLL